MPDYRDPKRWSNKRIQGVARWLRKVLGISNVKLVDVIAIVMSGWIHTIEGKKQLHVEVLPDEQMGDADGLTEFVGDAVYMRFKKSVWDKALKRDGRSVWTIAHELGHVVFCHKDAVRARKPQDGPYTSFVAPYESSERIAHEFASHFLMEEELLSDYSDALRAAGDFGVSMTVAKKRIEKRLEKRKDSVQKGFENLLRRFEKGKDSTHEVKTVKKEEADKEHVDDRCLPGEDKQTVYQPGRLMPCGGNRYEDLDSGIVSNHLQDGDDFDGIF
jgi:Zn-dependent peptidase ImmA (M78 family)